VLRGDRTGSWHDVDTGGTHVGLLLHGLFYAATDGVLMAYAGPLVPEALRASGLAVVQTGQAVARLLSSVLFGVLLTVLTMKSAVWIVFLAFLFALVGAAMLVGRKVFS
jgi:MFS family permease